MKKRIFSILLVVVMTMALVACGTKAPSSPVNETVEAVSESSEATSVPETSTEVLPDSEAVETESAESASEPETSTEENSEAISETESDEVASTPDSEAVVEPEFTVTEVSKTLYAVQSVNVRSGPSTDYDKIGGLTTNQEVQVTGQASTGWYRIEYNGGEAYVSGKYLSDSKVEKPAASETPSNGSGNTAGTGSTASNSCPYTLWQPVDNGTSITWYCAWPDPEWDTKHKSTLYWIYQTLNDRNTGSIPEGMIGGTEQTESTIMGYYAEGEVRRQTYEFHLYPAN